MSDTYIESLAIEQIEAQPWLPELVTNTKAPHSSFPLCAQIYHFLESAGSSGEPGER